MKRILILLIALLVAACSTQQITPKMIASMSSYADAYDLAHPDDADGNTARICATEPIALYWSESLQSWAVACKVPYPNSYGIVVMDSNDIVLNIWRISAASQSALDDILASVEWERQ